MNYLFTNRGCSSGNVGGYDLPLRFRMRSEHCILLRCPEIQLPRCNGAITLGAAAIPVLGGIMLPQGKTKLIPSLVAHDTGSSELGQMTSLEKASMQGF
ncbi:hypothetical protein BDZ91DRAFT_439478 [Kalaharituber pfeilii]|nr:hypothetical protein BDZ91DRAFT_439478 [Kalaharituber pfeilii]